MSSTVKKCSSCDVQKPIEEFYRSKASKDGHKTVCKKCCLESNSKSRKLRDRKYNATDAAKKASRKYRTTRKAQYQFLQRNAAKRKIEVDLTFEEFQQIRSSEACHYCGGSLPEVGGGLDRIDNKLGYTKENVLTCCHSCNLMRGDRISAMEMKAAIAAVHEQRDRSISNYMSEGIHIDNRRLFISGEIGPETSHKIMKAIDELEAINPYAPIKLEIMSEGGCWTDALAIYDRIKASPCRFIATGHGLVASSATVIFQAASDRILNPHCLFLIHDGFEGFEGDPKSFEAHAAQSKLSRQIMYQIYADRSGKLTLFWENRCSHDSILTATETVKLGLADRIAGETQEESK